MRKHLLFTIVLGLASFASGCAHSAHTKGSVVVKHSATEADICLGEKEVTPGDKVALFRHDCKQRPANIKDGGEKSVCTQTQVGTGEVQKTIDEHYSIIKVAPGTEFKEGTVVEKL